MHLKLLRLLTSEETYWHGLLGVSRLVRRYIRGMSATWKKREDITPTSIIIHKSNGSGSLTLRLFGEKNAFKQSRFKNSFTMRFKSSNRRTSTCLMSLEASAAALATILSSIKGNTLLRSATEQSKPDKPVLGAFGWFCVSKQVQETVRDHAWGVIWPWMRVIDDARRGLRKAVGSRYASAFKSRVLTGYRYFVNPMEWGKRYCNIYLLEEQVLNKI